MPNLLVLYYSRTGNTEKLAQAVAEGARNAGVEVSVKRVEDVSPEDALKYDGIAMGSPVYYGTMSAGCKKFLDDSVKFHGDFQGKVGGAFASSANVGGGNETTIMDILKAWLIHGMVMPGYHEGDHYGTVAIGAPDERAIKNARNQGKILANFILKLSRQK